VAFTLLQIERARAIDGPRPTLPVVRGWVREIMGLLYVLHNRRRPSIRLRSAAQTPSADSTHRCIHAAAAGSCNGCRSALQASST